MSDKKETRRQHLFLQAVKPEDGKLTAEVQISFDEDHVAYNWRWDKADPDDSTLPIGYATRFRNRLL